jgi:hypothetical protein
MTKYSKNDLNTTIEFIKANLKSHPQSKGTTRNTLDKNIMYKYFKQKGISKEVLDTVKNAESEFVGASYLVAIDKLQPQAEAMNNLGALNRTRSWLSVPLIGTGGTPIDIGTKLRRQSAVPQDKSKIVTTYGAAYIKAKSVVPIDEATAKEAASAAEHIFNATEKQNYKKTA